MKAKKHTLVYAAEPAGSPLRMQCTNCHATPSVKCRSYRGKDMDTYHREREDDFKVLRETEAKLASWNQQYGKAV